MTRPAAAPWWWWPFVAAASVLSLALHGLALQGADNDFWLPFVQRAARPELFPGDPALGTVHASLSYHVDVMGILTRLLGLENAFFLAYIVAHSALFAVFAILSRDLLDDIVAAAMSVMLLVLSRPIGGTATVTVEDLLIPRFIAEVLGLAAVVLALRRRPIASGVLLGLTLLEHPLTGLPFFAAVLGRSLLIRRHRAAALRTAVAGAIVGLPVLVRYIGARTSSGRESFSDAAWWDVARQDAPFSFVGTWSDSSWIFVLAFVALLLLGLAEGHAARESLSLATGALALAAFGVLLGEGLRSVSLVGLQPARAFMVPILLALVLAGTTLLSLLSAGGIRSFVGGALLASLLAGWWGSILVMVAMAGILFTRERIGLARAAALGAGLVAALAFVGPWREIASEMLVGRPLRVVIVVATGLVAMLVARHVARRPILAPAGALVLCALLLAWVGPARFERPWDMPLRPVAEIARWARESTPLSTRFAVPAAAGGFRKEAQRTVMLEPTDGPLSLLSRDYARRSIELRRRFGTDASLDSLVEEVRSGAIDVLVLPRDAPGVPLPMIHADAYFRAHARAEP